MNIEIKEDFVAPFLNVDPKWIDELIASKTDIQNKVICIEELSELTKEITKEIRGEDNKYEIVDEMVDVMLIQYFVDDGAVFIGIFCPMYDGAVGDSILLKLQQKFFEVAVGV